MRNNFLIVALTGLILLPCSLKAQKYKVTGIQRQRIVVDTTFDAPLSKKSERFFMPYKLRVDSLMSPVVGHAARNLAVYRPESELGNLMADILIWAAPKYGEKPDFSIYNVGGIRAAIDKGDVTVGDILSVAPFENKICFITLTGRQVKELFSEMASVFGECVSHGVRIVFGKDHSLVSACINGQPIEDNRNYRVATIDYVVQGNDRMKVFKSGTDLNSPQTQENNIRYIVMDYFREQMARGKAVDKQKEGRIVIKAD